ncbi:MAG: FxDxF family PEP-CTERM protein [Betaproteobacteria bacterium]|nr:FxDxF family PEP-CTERM protein [Betaproteobacteria bacterium]
MQLKQTVIAIALGLGFSAFAQADVVDLGTFTFAEPIKEYAANPNPAALGEVLPFSDTYTFSIANDLLGIDNPTMTSSVINIDLMKPLLNIEDFSVSVYKGSVVDPAFLVFDQPSGRFALDWADYTLVVSGTTTGYLGGMYTLSLSAAPALPAVPEPAEYAMLLAGLGLVGMVVRRRKINVN